MGRLCPSKEEGGRLNHNHKQEGPKAEGEEKKLV
jgi:hypothetical protein